MSHVGELIVSLDFIGGLSRMGLPFEKVLRVLIEEY